MKESKDSKIKGVIANFGKKDVDIEKQIELLELDVVDTKKLENEIRQLDKNIRTEIDKIHDNKKGNISTQKKTTSKTNKEVILLYNEDVAKAKKIENNEEKLIDFKGDKCEFCGGSPNLEFIRRNIEKYNSNEKQKAAVALNDFKTKLEILLSQIDNLLLVKDNISNNLEKDVSNSFNNIQTS